MLVTVPLGVLKASQPFGVADQQAGGTTAAAPVPAAVPRQKQCPGALAFSPPLPLRKRLAAERLGFGLLNKVVLRFPINFWRAAIGNQDLLRAAQKVPPGRSPATARSAACCRSPGEEERRSSGHGREVEAKKEEQQKTPPWRKRRIGELARRFNFRLLLGWC